MTIKKNVDASLKEQKKLEEQQNSEHPQQEMMRLRLQIHLQWHLRKQEEPFMIANGFYC